MDFVITSYSIHYTKLYDHPDVSLPENFQLLIQNTEPAASAGLASIQLPIGLGKRSGLPVGMELDGPAGSDRRLLAIGLAIENVIGCIAMPR